MISEAWVRAGARKTARPFLTAIAAGLPTRQNSSAAGLLGCDRVWSTHPPERKSPTMATDSQGHNRGLESVCRTGQEKNDDD